MGRYIIKNNLPDKERELLKLRYGSLEGIYTSTARNMFMYVVEFLRNQPRVKIIEMNYRNEKKKPLRGTIKVEIDSFYYYVELMPL